MQSPTDSEALYSLLKGIEYEIVIKFVVNDSKLKILDNWYKNRVI